MFFFFFFLYRYHSLFVTDNSCAYFWRFEGVGGVGGMIIAWHVLDNRL